MSPQPASGAQRALPHCPGGSLIVGPPPQHWPARLVADGAERLDYAILQLVELNGSPLAHDTAKVLAHAGRDARALPLGRGMQVGEQFVLFGYGQCASGTGAEQTATTTFGRCAGYLSEAGQLPNTALPRFYKLDGAVLGGHSGGPVVNRRGEVTSVAARSDSTHSLGQARPIELLESALTGVLRLHSPAGVSRDWTGGLRTALQGCIPPGTFELDAEEWQRCRDAAQRAEAAETAAAGHAASASQSANTAANAAQVVAEVAEAGADAAAAAVAAAADAREEREAGAAAAAASVAEAAEEREAAAQAVAVSVAAAAEAREEREAAAAEAAVAVAAAAEAPLPPPPPPPPQQQQQQQAVEGVPVQGVPVHPVHDDTFEPNVLKGAGYIQCVRRFKDGNLTARELNCACYISREGIEQPLGCDLEDTDADRRIADAFLRGYDGWDEAGEQGDESDAFDAGREAQERGDQEDNDQVMACIDFLKGCDPSNRLIDWHAFYNCPHNGGPWRNSSGMKHVVERAIDNGWRYS